MPVHNPADYPSDQPFVGASDGLNGFQLTAAAAATAAVALPAVTTITAACTAAPVSAPAAATGGGVLGALSALWIRK